MGTKKPATKRDTVDHRHEGVVSKVEGFNERGARAVKDRDLHDSVALFTNKTLTGRKKQLEMLPEAPELRDQAYHIKQQTMANLGHYLE
ncbi:MAG: hypothetical protein ACR2G1_10430, partial [Rubrobacteraceae bacterium]